MDEDSSPAVQISADEIKDLRRTVDRMIPVKKAAGDLEPAAMLEMMMRNIEALSLALQNIRKRLFQSGINPDIEGYA